MSFKTFAFLFVAGLSLALVSGCGDSNAPQGPEPGSVQRYLDDNPDVAARLNEGDGPEEEEDSDTYDDE